MSKHRVLRTIAILVPVARADLIRRGGDHSAFCRLSDDTRCKRLSRASRKARERDSRCKASPVKWIPLAVELTGITARADGLATNRRRTDEKPLLSINRLQLSLEFLGIASS